MQNHRGQLFVGNFFPVLLSNATLIRKKVQFCNISGAAQFSIISYINICINLPNGLISYHKVGPTPAKEPGNLEERQ
jgi:hypothetical protein